MFQKRMRLLPEFKLSKEKADLSWRPLQIPEKTPSETSQEPDPHEESMEVGGSDAETAMVPPEGDGSVRPKTSGTEMLPANRAGEEKPEIKEEEQKGSSTMQRDGDGVLCQLCC